MTNVGIFHHNMSDVVRADLHMEGLLRICKWWLMPTTFENRETKLTYRNHHLIRYLHWSIPQMKFTCGRHATELFVANT